MWLRSFLAYFLALFTFGILLFFSEDLQKLLGNSTNDQSQSFKLLNSLMRAPKVYLNPEENSISKTKTNCLYYTCFDVYKCGGDHKKILVHISEPLRPFIGKYFKSYKS